jgi:hypothetical protein
MAQLQIDVISRIRSVPGTDYHHGLSAENIYTNDYPVFFTMIEVFLFKLRHS